jgi:hypothetical protein
VLQRYKSFKNITDFCDLQEFLKIISELKFLNFFFERLRINDTGSYQNEFPYLSPCGRERNFVRCDDLPIVFTKLQVLEEKLVLPYNYCGTKHVNFEPNKLYMGSSGRIYHPGPEKLHGIGLIKSSLAIELSQDFTFGADGHPTHFNMQKATFELDDSLKTNLLNLGRPE